MPIASEECGTPRVAVLRDVPALVDVINRAYVVEEFFLHGPRTTEQEARALMTAPGARFLVLDAPSGGIAASVFMEVAGDRGYFAMLAVDPALQRRGLARRLLDAVETTCRGAGCRFLDLDVVNVRTELPPFYQKLGFTPCGTRVFEDVHKLKREVHVIAMTKPLS